MDKRIPDFSHPDVFVTFLIGPEPNPTKFVVHREFACYHSKVLNAAFNSNFIEGQTQTYQLEDTTPGTFKLLVQWLYTQKLKISQLTCPEQFGGLAEKVDRDADVCWYEEDMNLARLWVLADRLGMPKLQNNVMFIIVGISNFDQPDEEPFSTSMRVQRKVALFVPLQYVSVRPSSTLSSSHNIRRHSHTSFFSILRSIAPNT
ncbi:hypothetical protein IFR04_002068 [Cadophora malorum]|uniref:BTB domain-containing protein n=1 Tax=Cadophora malorum TaxID=108018 RepID=A0A8H7WH46_9HELO|nr:hypothetical protein IFR04_002068 [Cadophora malorum]